MRIYAIAILAVVTGAAVARDIKPHEIMECKARNKVSMGDVRSMMNKKVPRSKGGKCMIACLMKKTDMMTNDGKVSVNEMHAVVEEKHKNNTAKLQRAKKIINECVKELQNKKLDECETAAKMTECSLRKAKQKN